MQVTQRARRKAMQNIETEGRKSIDIMLCSALIALYRNWGYRKWRLSRLMQETQNARNAAAPKDDNWIDIAGYAACGGEVDDGQSL